MLPFIAAKALAFLPFGGLLRGATGKLILVLVVVGALAFGYWKWKDNIKTALLNEINQETAEQILRDKEDQIRRQNEFLIEQGKINERLMQLQRERIANSNELSEIIKNVKPEDDGPVAPILRNVFEQINLFEGNVGPADVEAGVDKEEPSVLDSTVESIKSTAESTGNKAIDAWKKLTDE